MKEENPRFEELLQEVTKYMNIGNIVYAINTYKENETLLDKQIRELKNEERLKNTEVSTQT